MGNELAGKVAIVTGGSNGLGLATVELFLEEGAKVVIGDIDPSGASVAEELGTNCRFGQTDMAKVEEIQALVDFAVSEFGRLDIMCNNAGIPSHMVRLLDDPFDDFDRNLNVNLLGVMRGTQIAARAMKETGGGSIINTSSIAGVLASCGVSTYRAAKAAVIQFTKTAAIDLAEYGIRVNCLMPGQIETKIMKDALSDPELDADKLQRLDQAVREIMKSYQPLKRKGTPRDVAQAALFFAGERSAYVTGAVLPVDGGITAGHATNYIEKFAQARAEVLAS